MIGDRVCPLHENYFSGNALGLFGGGGGVGVFVGIVFVLYMKTFFPVMLWGYFLGGVGCC